MKYTGRQLWVTFTSTVRMWEKYDLGDFVRGMIVGAKKNIWRAGALGGGIALFTREVDGEWADRFQLTEGLE